MIRLHPRSVPSATGLDVERLQAANSRRTGLRAILVRHAQGNAGQHHRPIRDATCMSRCNGPSARDGFELAINSLLDPADCQEVDPRFHPTGLDLVADLESPFSDARI